MQNKPHELQSKSGSSKQKKGKRVAAADLEDCYEVIDFNVHVPQQHMSPFWLKNLELRQSDKDQLLYSKWLTDKHVRTNCYKSNVPTRMVYKTPLFLP